ncbi:DinB family protein [Edaphobacter paludis]
MVATNMSTCLGKLTDEQIWSRGGAHENAVGNIVLHLCGNIRQWVMHGISGTEDIRVREAEFSADGGVSGTVLAEMFAATVAEARTIIARLPPERLTDRTSPQPGRPEVSVLEAIYQVVAHAHEHVGQIILVTKQMITTDLDLTMPRPR